MPLHDHIPREIFEIILHLCVGLDTPVRDLVTLQLVCRTWHDIIAETCFLWGTISTQEGPKAFRKAFQMAKASPLDIIFKDRSDIEATEFFSLTGKKIDQWRWLVIEAERVEDALTTIQTQKPPNLILLSVESTGLIEPEEADIVLFGGAPVTGLEHLRLIGTPINLTPLALRLSGLKSLLLQQIPSITAADMITLLTNSPTLEMLHLSKLEDAVLLTEPTTGEPNLSFHSPIQLPFLANLNLDNLPVPFHNFLRFSGLKSLLLQQLPSITAVGIVALLTDSPSLRTLELSKLKDAVLPTEPATGEPNLSFHSPIQLPFLTHLKLDDLPVPFLSFLLSNLVVPRLRFLKIKPAEPTAQLLAVGGLHLSATLSSVTSGAQDYKVTLRTRRALRRYAITIGRLSMTLIGPLLDSENEIQETFDRLFDHLRGAVALADIPLHLTLEGSNPGLSDLEWFTRRTNVTRFTVSHKPSREYALIDITLLLGRPTSGPSPIWLLPQLEVFENDLAFTGSHNLILDMIKARHAVFPESFPGPSGASPKRFREIRLSYNGPGLPPSMERFMSEVIQAAEGAEVYWGGKKWTELRDAGGQAQTPRVAGFTSQPEP